MEEVKSPFLSKTIWGAAMVVGAMVAQLLGYDLGDANSNADAVIALIGAALAIYGRIKAVHKIGKPE